MISRGSVVPTDKDVVRWSPPRMDENYGGDRRTTFLNYGGDRRTTF